MLVSRHLTVLSVIFGSQCCRAETSSHASLEATPVPWLLQLFLSKMRELNLRNAIRAPTSIDLARTLTYLCEVAWISPDVASWTSIIEIKIGESKNKESLRFHYYYFSVMNLSSDRLFIVGEIRKKREKSPPSWQKYLYQKFNFKLRCNIENEKAEC